MLAIRMQRLGRKGHPTYRVVVQDVRQTPSSGKYVAMLGSYDPHTKTSTLAKDKAEFYLKNGARPSDRVIRLLQTEGVSLPGWVKQPTKNTRELRNPDKLRKNQPEKPADEVTEESTEEPSTEAEAPAEQTPEAVEAVDSTEEKTKE